MTDIKELTEPILADLRQHYPSYIWRIANDGRTIHGLAVDGTRPIFSATPIKENGTNHWTWTAKMAGIDTAMILFCGLDPTGLRREIAARATKQRADLARLGAELDFWAEK